MEHDKVAALRRVAIVLSSLPEATAGRLIMGLGSDQQRAVRMALSALDDVDPLEHRRALDGFLTSIRRGRSPLAGHNDAAEIVLSPVALQHPEQPIDCLRPGRSNPSSAASPLGFLSDVDDDALAERVRDEHPQTIAIILALIAPSQAARILSKFDVLRRTEAMRRLAKFDAPPVEVVDDIASQLKNKLLASGTHFASSLARGVTAPAMGTTAGQATLRAILAEMPEADADPKPATSPANQAVPESSHPHRAVRKGATNQAPSAGRSDAAPEPPSDAARATGPSADATEAIHARLVALPIPLLRQALASVPTRLSLLALCGLPSATAQQVLGSLPRRQARQIRQQLTDIGTLELREIDRAKAAVARAVDALEQENPHSPATAAA